MPSGSGQATTASTPHWPYRAVPLRYWQSDNRTSTAVLPHLRATQKGNLARPHSRSPQAVRKPEGLAMHCHLHRGDWSFHLKNEKKKSYQSQYADTGPSSPSADLKTSPPGRASYWSADCWVTVMTRKRSSQEEMRTAGTT